MTSIGGSFSYCVLRCTNRYNFARESGIGQDHHRHGDFGVPTELRRGENVPAKRTLYFYLAKGESFTTIRHTSE